MFNGVVCRLLIELLILGFLHAERQLGERYRIACEGRKNKIYLQLPGSCHKWYNPIFLQS